RGNDPYGYSNHIFSCRAVPHEIGGLESVCFSHKSPPLDSHSVISRRDQSSISDLTAAPKYRSAAGRKVCTIAPQVTHVTNSPSGRLCDNAHRRPGVKSNRGNGLQ